MSKSPSAIEPSSEDRTSVRDRWIALVVAAAGALVSLPGVYWGLPMGKTICGALRVLAGEVPYRDFWTMYAPGQFYATAGLFRLFGSELVVQGIAIVIIYGAIGGAMFLVVRRAAVRRPIAALISSAVMMSFWGFAPEFGTYPPALLCALVAIDRVLCYLHKGGLGKLFFAGLLLGVAACFKHDVAFYIMAAMVVMLFASWFGTASRRPSLWSHPIRATFALAGGAVVIVVPAIILLALSAGKYAWQDLVIWPATDFRGVRTEGMPRLPNWNAVTNWVGDLGDLRRGRDAVVGQAHYILCNMPLYVFILSAISLPFLWCRLTATRLAASLLLITMFPFFWTVAHVQPNTHVYTMAVSSLCLMAMALPRKDVTLLRKKLLRGVLIGALAFYTLGLIAYPANALARIAVNWSGRRHLEVPGARGIWVSKYQYDVYHPIVKFIRQHVPPDERIYAGLKRHDSPVISDLKFYYLTGRKNCCRYDELHSGITDRADVQQEIIDAIEEHNVRCVVIWRFGWPQDVLDMVKESNMATIPGLGNTLLDEFIAETFETIGQYGEYDLMWRKGVPHPSVEERTFIGPPQT